MSLVLVLYSYLRYNIVIKQKKGRCKMAKQKRFTDSEWEKIVSETTHISKTEVSRKYGISIPGLSYQMKKRNIEYDNQKFIKRKHYFNENFFETIDSESKAYFLGFIIADGSVERPTKWGKVNRLKINISHKDIEILKMFKKEIGADTVDIETYIPSAETYSQNPMSRFTLNSVKLCDDLKKYGVIKNKRTKEVLPILDKDLMPHLIRGFFDGDGSIYARQINGKPLVSFTKSKSVLTGIREYLIKELNVSPGPSILEVGSGRKSYTYRLSSAADNENFYHFIYDNANFYLNRKYEKFTSLLSQ